MPLSHAFTLYRLANQHGQRTQRRVWETGAGTTMPCLWNHEAAQIEQPPIPVKRIRLIHVENRLVFKLRRSAITLLMLQQGASE